MGSKFVGLRLPEELATALERHCQRWQCNQTEAITRVLACSWGVAVPVASRDRARVAQQRRRAREGRAK